METFTIRDLRYRTGDLVRNAEQGNPAIVAKQGSALFVAVPMDDALLRHGVQVALAIELFKEGPASLGTAAKLARLDRATVIDRLSSLGSPAVDYPAYRRSLAPGVAPAFVSGPLSRRRPNKDNPLSGMIFFSRH